MSTTSVHPANSGSFHSDGTPRSPVLSASSSPGPHPHSPQKDSALPNRHWADLKRNSSPETHYNAPVHPHPPPQAGRHSVPSLQVPGRPLSPSPSSSPQHPPFSSSSSSSSSSGAPAPNALNTSGGMNAAMIEARKKEEQRKLAIKNAHQESLRYDGVFAVNNESIYFNFILPVLPSLSSSSSSSSAAPPSD
eukprot:TRINITY_DN6529_c0_g1_i1.p1 TRINITY_DN6529_c0_g1~~TRINITY_DN6529_c0_g1_i1.p1  ORF type:complete len:192 (+),score=100.46 TRINITY_DN6529_c0_g1_i1:330-905(+)